MNSNTYIDAALILWNPDVIELVSLALRDRNLKSKGFEPSAGTERMVELIQSCNPSVVLFDLEPPYDRSSAIVVGLMNQFPDCSFVMTCADPKLVRRTAPWLRVHPMFQKPYQVDALAGKVDSIVRSPYRNLKVETTFLAKAEWKQRVENEVQVFGPALYSPASAIGRRRLLN